MGCNCSRDTTKLIVAKPVDLKNKNLFRIKIHIPNSDKIKIVSYEGNTEYIIFYELINDTMYSGIHADTLDSNFISVYNKQTDAFDYFIQRLLGYQIEESDPYHGKIWTPYLNGKRESFSDLCSKNRIIYSSDEIDLKYENYNIKEK
jgi:hypothetical protein